MKIYFIADIHAQQGKELSYYKDGIPSRLLDFVEALEWVRSFLTIVTHYAILPKTLARRFFINSPRRIQ